MILRFFYWMVSNLSLCIKIWPCLQMTKLGKIKHHIYNRYFIYRLKKNKVLGCARYTLCTNHQLFSPLDVDHFYPTFFHTFVTASLHLWYYLLEIHRHILAIYSKIPCNPFEYDKYCKCCYFYLSWQNWDHKNDKNS